MAASPMTDHNTNTTTMSPGFDRQTSTESGRDNPFRPDGDISREADEIVQLIKSGRPLLASSPRASDTPDGTLASPDSKDTVSEPLISPQLADVSHTSPPSSPKQSNDVLEPKSPSSPGLVGSNGSAAPNDNSKSPATVEVKHVTVKPKEAAHVEHVVIKKKSKCNCCVIQ